MPTLLKWTIEAYHRLIDQEVLAEKKVELLDGDIVIMPPESPLHSYTTRKSTDYLRQKFQNTALIIESHPITLSTSEPEPDITVAIPPQERYKERHPTPNDIFWIIEISNVTLAYDLNDKKRVYAQAGISEYWVVDLNARQVFIFRDPSQSDYQTQQTLSTGVIIPQAFPKLELSILELFHW
ncbi:Uma2 family endonuclease [Candidatus Synechococcus calcipolaris G9]|uniref:Uma2 family endonuclease n=1 Tax=Candidatus Synechococcus calcipolaris G9 TaxID=1497997 RepID=A0ABT6EZY1_9SYNE|nr:Uma2 family endonuclease [Candidatus Synechococcus calcipolaris]MDG2991161.1 Uma2 family endonuclease [Candidatus Synechococcus calcipolaris G9]